MSTAIDQKAYLQKYLSGASADKKKKKKKTVKGKGFKIIDDDLDLSKLRPLDGDELDILDQGEDAPQIAGIIDERPEEIKKLEQFKTSSKWRVVNQDDGFNSKLEIEEIKKDIKEQEKENELVFGKMYSDSEDEKINDSDLSPQRNHSKNALSKKHKNNSDSDLSPPRKGESELPPKKSNSVRENRYSDLSSSRNTKQASISQKNSSAKHKDNSDSDFSPPKRNEKEHKSHNKRDYNFDLSPPEKQENQKSKDRIRKPSRWGEPDENLESTSKRLSPSRQSRKRWSSKSPQTELCNDAQHKRRSSFDNESHRKTQKSDHHRNDDSDISPPRKNKLVKKRNKTPDSDISPPRKRKEYNDSNHKSKVNEIFRKHSRKKSSDSDVSPPRKDRNKRPHSPSSSRQIGRNHLKSKHDSDSDLSPPRRDKNKLLSEDKRLQRSSDSPPPSNKKMARTLEGKKAGLQDARELRSENETFRRKEDEAFSRMTDEVSGRNAQAVSRKGKRETSEDRQKQREKANRQKELDEKYKKWSKGLKQLQDQESRMQDYIHEASKPLARHKDDKDLEGALKDIERDGDPMLQYIREKKRERGELGPEKPRYKGSFPPNRFNIRPGYRWDGVDRSNGYEKKYFDQQSKRKAQEEEAYKWSTEDL